MINGEKCSSIVEYQSRGEIIVPAERGRIIDSKGRILANNIPRKSFFAYPQTRADATKIASHLHRYMKTTEWELKNTLTENLEGFTWLCRKLPDNKAENLNKKELPGLFSQTEMKRVYPNKNLILDLIGSVTVDNQGNGGLEYALNSNLCGTSGRSMIERDAFGKVYRVASKQILLPQNGSDVALTIDLDWQAIVEDELKKGVDEYNAKSGTVVFLKPNDGAVLAMACYTPASVNSTSTKNEAISDLFEPGSAFKLITVSAALEEGALKPTDLIDCGHGKAQFSGLWIHDDKELDTLTLRDIFRLSSNVGVGHAAVKTGARKLYKYSKYFGFGKKCGIDLPGEHPGSLKEPEVWSDFFAAQLAMGHGLSVNALQMAAAFNVITSNGALYKPYIIREITKPNGEVVKRGSSRKVRTILSKKTCDILKTFLADVVDSGTAQYAKSDKVHFSGKTGTPQKPDFINGGYHQNHYTPVFAGYFPSENPVAVGVVYLDDPQPIHYSGFTSARIFAKAAERIVSLENINGGVKYAESTEKITDINFQVPDLTGYTLSSARSILDSLKLDIQIIGDGDIIVEQQPAPNTVLHHADRLILCLGNPDPNEKENLNQLVGLSVRRAVKKLVDWGYQIELRGTGFVKKVEELNTNNKQKKPKCRLYCKID